MIDKININQISDHPVVSNVEPFDGSSAGQKPSKAVASNKADATLQIDYARLIEQAVNSKPTETDAVQKAKELLQSGQLDNPANIKEAAANIIKFGV